MRIPCMEVTYADGRVTYPFPALRTILAVYLPHDPVRLPMMVTVMRGERQGGSCPAFMAVFRFLK